MADELSADSMEYGLGVYNCRGPRALTHAGFIEMPEGEHWGWDQTMLLLGILKRENLCPDTKLSRN
jgi:hypothetical protein